MKKLKRSCWKDNVYKRYLESQEKPTKLEAEPESILKYVQNRKCVFRIAQRDRQGGREESK